MSKGKEINEVIFSGSGTDLYFWMSDPDRDSHCFTLIHADDGGYSGVDLSRENWKQIREKIDALVEQHLSQ